LSNYIFNAELTSIIWNIKFRESAVKYYQKEEDAMFLKYLEKKVNLNLPDFANETDTMAELEYYLIESSIANDNRILNYGNHLNDKNSAAEICAENRRSNSYELKTYGIEIVKKNKSAIESEHIINLTTSKKEAVKMLDMLANNCVTPITLHNVIDDYIGI